MAKAAERQFLVQLSGGDKAAIAGMASGQRFQTKTGGDITAASTKVFDGGSNSPSILMAPPELSNVTVTRAYDHKNDATILSHLRQWVGSSNVFTLSITDLDEDLHGIAGGARIYHSARLVGLTEPPVDSSSGTAAMWGLEFAVVSVAGK